MNISRPPSGSGLGLPGLQDNQGDAGIGSIKIAVFGYKRKAAEQVAPTPGTAFQFLAGNDFLNPALKAEKSHLLVDCRLDRPAGTAGAVAVYKGKSLEALAATGRDSLLQPVEGLLDQGHALFQVDEPVQGPPGRTGFAGAALCLAKGTLRPSGFDLIAADLADQIRHGLTLSTRRR